MQLNSPEEHNPNSLRSKVAQVQGYVLVYPQATEVSKLLTDVWNGLYAIEKLYDNMENVRAYPFGVLDAIRRRLEGEGDAD